jgi:asparagine synthase (glutamine-hydrolysing)
MPGIAGIISHRPVEESQHLVRAMVLSMEHESFCTSGVYAAPKLGVCVGWVAHENSFTASQVFLNEQKDVAFIVSGECFVDQEVRCALKRNGHRLEDANNWLVHLYEEEGERCFEKVNGFFSGLLMDRRLGKALLFNDRYGMERIYCHESNGTIYFASEAKALLRILPETRAFDEQGVAQFLAHGCTLEGRTLFRGIQLLPGASLWSFEGGKTDKRTYFSPMNWESQPQLSAADFEARFQETFKRILPRYFKSGSGIGISLTAGLDTRMIMACLPDSGERPLCYTFSGENGETLDDRLAAQVARACGLEHRLLRIGADFFSDFKTHVDRTVYITDGCFGVTGAHEIYLNRQARQVAVVRLTGNYGSEVLRGVSTFKPLMISPDLFHSQFVHTQGSLEEPFIKGIKHPVTFAAFREIPWHLFGSFAAARSQVSVRTPYLDNEIVALAYQVPEGLRNSPIPAWDLVKANSPLLSKIPTDRRPSRDSSRPAATVRRFFSEAMFKLDYLYNEGWPSWLSPVEPIFARVASTLKIIGLHKYLHYRSWFRHELAEYLKSVVNDSQTRQSQYLNCDFLRQIANEHINGRNNHVVEIDALLTLEAVERLLLRGFSSQQHDRAERGSPTLLVEAAK